MSSPLSILLTLVLLIFVIKSIGGFFGINTSGSSVGSLFETVFKGIYSLFKWIIVEPLWLVIRTFIRAIHYWRNNTGR